MCGKEKKGSLGGKLATLGKSLAARSICGMDSGRQEEAGRTMARETRKAATLSGLH